MSYCRLCCSTRMNDPAESSSMASGKPRLNPICCVHSTDGIQSLDCLLKLQAAHEDLIFLCRVENHSPLFCFVLCQFTFDIPNWWGHRCYLSTRMITLGFHAENLRLWKHQFVADIQSELTRNRLVAISATAWPMICRRILSEGFWKNVKCVIQPLTIYCHCRNFSTR